MVSSRALAAGVFIALALFRSVALADIFKNPGQVISPCGTNTIDTTGWREVRVTSSTDNRCFRFRMPPTFGPDSTVGFQHGGHAWRDLTRRVMWYNGGGIGCKFDDPAGSCSQCDDSLSGLQFGFASWYNPYDNLHRVGAERYVESPFGWSEVLVGSSPDSADQELLLTIVRSMREEVREVARGTLYVGGRRLSPPYTLKTVRGRVVVNRSYLPDVLPPNGCSPNPNAELEFRSGLTSHLLSRRDSLLREGQSWDDVKQEITREVQRYAGVRVGDDQGNPMLIWNWGYQYFTIGREHSYGLGSGRRCFEETDSCMSARLDYLRAVLDAGNVVFLLGGGAEHILPPAYAEAAVDGVRRIQLGKPLTKKQERLLPVAVRNQVASPLKDEPER